MSELTYVNAGEARLPARDSARLGPTALQYALAAAAILGVALGFKIERFGTAGALGAGFFLLFSGACTWRVVLAIAAEGRPRLRPAPLAWKDLPAYTIIAPLYDEAAMLPGLLTALAAIDYPRERLQVILALEPDDMATRGAAAQLAASSPIPFEIALSPQTGPRTKPKACNAALALARGDLVTVYDAEDRPGPGQLREAAARFAAGPARLACLQAPLRIAPGRGWLQRQFALEYGALFEVLLPGHAALGLPFPLGGTSNHFRRTALSGVGGWDAWNVTEDADLGFRLAAQGWRLGVLDTPTIETAPPTLAVWTPQRTRWVKGHMQTWGVHMRRPWRGGWRRFAALQLTLGLSVLSSLLHGALATGVVACLLVALASAQPPGLQARDVALLFGGWLTAMWVLAIGARASGERLRTIDAVTAPLYWPLQSLAAMFAIWQLVAAPFHWDKTPHEPVADGPTPG